MTSPATLRSLLDLSRDDLVAWVEAAGERSYRADQVRRWIFGKRAESFDDFHDVPKALRERLAREYRFFTSEIVNHQIAKDRTEKLLLQLSDGSHVECVLMREGTWKTASPDQKTEAESQTSEGRSQTSQLGVDRPRGHVESRVAKRSLNVQPATHNSAGRRTVCISTQVGCAMGCVFCASGMLGVKRNLTTTEILEQVLRIDRLLGPHERLTNVVVMGIGEPLANLRNLLPAVDTLNDKGGLGLGARRITISTVGLPEKIGELAAHGKPYNLAVSLHAPNDALRTRLVPVNRSIGVAAILAAADDYFERTGRRVTYEYVLLGGINDEPDHARELGQLLAERVAHVNLIPMNAVNELPFGEPSAPRTQEFVEILSRFGVAATVRKRKGADIDAACGQLRLKQERKPLVTL